MKKIFVLILTIFLLLSAFSQNNSEDIEISVLTCSPGPELYTAFGHSAIRVRIPQANKDYVFNYGSFNFNTPNFYVKFVRGQLNYMLAVERYKSFEREYSEANRDVYAQVLNLDAEQKEKIYKYLMWKSLPENKYYLYDFFFDNCATRVRDVLSSQLGDSIIYQQREYDQTLRQMLNPYLENRAWLHFGINTMIGLPSDQKANSHLAMYLPDHLDTILSNTQIINQNGKMPIVAERKHIIKSVDNDKKSSFFKKNFTPAKVLWLVFVIISAFTAFEFVKNRKNFVLDFVLTVIFGIISLLVLLIWFGTEHGAAETNLNIVWALPTHIFLSFLFLKKKKSNFLKYYVLSVAIFNLLVFAVWAWFPQEFDFAAIPLILILTLRYFQTFLYLTKNQ